MKYELKDTRKEYYCAECDTQLKVGEEYIRTKSINGGRAMVHPVDCATEYANRYYELKNHEKAV